MAALLEMIIKGGITISMRNTINAFKSALKNLWRNRVTSLASISSVVATLMILGLIFTIVININNLVADFQSDYEEITVYLEDRVDENSRDFLMLDIKNIDGVRNVIYISKEQAMENWKADWGDKAYLLDGLDSNPLPNVLVVKLSNLERSATIAELISTLDGIEDVKYQQTLVKNIIYASRFIRTICFGIILTIIAIMVFIIGNTIKIAVNSRRTEITIMKYVGASSWYIRRPFIFEGIIIGLVAGLISTGLIYLLYSYIYENVNNSYFMLISAYIVEPRVIFIDLLEITLVLGIGIGFVGSMNAMRRHINV